MIGFLKGFVLHQDVDHCILDVNGVGYIVYVSSRFMVNLPKPEEKVSLFIETVVREDAMTLYGFQTLEEKHWFRLLTSVQGVGNRMGMAALSFFTPQELYAVIASADKASLVKVPGIGAKLATRIVTELKDKPALALPSGTLESPSLQIRAKGQKLPVGNSVQEDALLALEGLGFRRSEALPVVVGVIATVEGEAVLSEVIRACLKALSRV
ncbi:Holliday junction branch migration protein RuvA [Entomobacter blattae]|uniref:Holliday junction branch migration complex subunit RuvA n=1 Tax=Entomobacter blattae TaxID=2762277 RepID=A0A7H1NTE3_9PROT|nr:Holliday junction branch migration protein RuvA [Entomobacter blattae]QNT79053.1 Holliday junction ATP-dependent DNA helicase RuvA [Entomobacter blattae]